MTKVVDSSVILAGILGERGGDVLDRPGELFHLSMVNLSEVYTKVVENGGRIEDVDAYSRPLPLRIRAFREAHAVQVALLRPRTRHRRLSLGDRAAWHWASWPTCPSSRRIRSGSVWISISTSV